MVNFSISPAPLPGKLQRVRRGAPCPICNHTDWCSTAENGNFAICMRVSDGSLRQARNKGYIHLFKKRLNCPPAPIFTQNSTSSLAPIERRNAAYLRWLGSLRLSGRHADDLLSRGLSDAEAARLLFATVPDRGRASTLCSVLAGELDLTGVPGFWRDQNGQWQAMVRERGFFIPVRDAHGQIAAMQIRTERGDSRYLWFSSPGKASGASSGTPVHFARPWRVVSTGEAIITEGPLKADIVAEFLDAGVVAVAGVSSFNDDFGYWLRSQIPNLHTVWLALDSDWHIKKAVERAMLRLLASVERANLIGGLFDWSGAKGLDDLLNQEVNGWRP